MSAATSIRSEMPLLARHEGTWQGTYTYVDSQGAVTDRHASVLTCGFPDDDTEYAYFQTNRYTWEDGREETIAFPATYRDGHIYFDTERINGHAWEVDDRVIVLTWNYLKQPGVVLYELIHLDESGRHRTRTWHWLRDGVCFQRTLIDEEKVSDAT